ncbi:hypothetical protein EON66_08050, partial [archaeon]
MGEVVREAARSKVVRWRTYDARLSTSSSVMAAISAGTASILLAAAAKVTMCSMELHTAAGSTVSLLKLTSSSCKAVHPAS